MIAKVNREGENPTFFFEAENEHEEAIVSEIGQLFEKGVKSNVLTFRPEAATSASMHVLVVDFDKDLE